MNEYRDVKILHISQMDMKTAIEAVATYANIILSSIPVTIPPNSSDKLMYIVKQLNIFVYRTKLIKKGVLEERCDFPCHLFKSLYIKILICPNTS